MATIRVFKDYLKDKPEVHNTDGEVNLVEWLADSEYSYIGEQGAVVQLNGSVIADSSQDADMSERTNIKIGLFDSVDIIARPHGVETLIIAGIALAAAAISIALMPEPAIPNDMGKRSESPNNQLNSATNSFRPRQAIPAISGQVVSYPDFIQPSYYVYQNNLKVVKEIFCIGEGSHLVEEVRTGETLIDDITGSSYIVHQPGSLPDELLNVRASNEVDGQEIPAPNESTATASLDGATIVSSNRIAGFDTQAIGLEDGDNIDIDIAWNNGVDTLTGSYAVSQVSSVAFNIVGVTLNLSQNLGDVTGTITNTSAGALGTWVTLEGDAVEEIRFHVLAPQGLRSSTDEFLNIALSLEAEQLDVNGNPTGVVTTFGASIGGKTLEAQYRTFKLNSDNGLTPDRYRARIVRGTNAEPAPGIDLVKFERVESVTPYIGGEFGDVTLLEVDRQATTQPVSGRRSKINALVTRKLPIFDPATGAFGTEAPTRSFAQHVVYLLNTVSGVPLDSIAYQELFDIESSLSDPLLSYFDFTFDNVDVSLQQRVESACNAARVKTYMVGNVWRFVREESKQIVEAQFTRRNVAPESSAQTFQMFRDNDFDSVELKYVDPVTNSEAYIRRRISSAGVVEAGLGVRVKEIDLAGCRNELQATDRANLEIRRIRYQRYSIRDTALMDALNVGVGSRVRWADINDAEVFHGEVLKQSGDVFTTSEKFIPEAGKTYYVYLTNGDGSVTNSVVASSRSDGNEFGFEATGLTAYLADGYQVQMGSTYIIATDTQMTDFILTRRGRPSDDGRVPIEGSVYNELMFEKDGQLSV